MEVKGIRLGIIHIVTFFIIASLATVLSIYAVFELDKNRGYFNQLDTKINYFVKNLGMITKGLSDSANILGKHIVADSVEEEQDLENQYKNKIQFTKIILDQMILKYDIATELLKFNQEHENGMINHNNLDVQLLSDKELYAILAVHWGELENLANKIVKLSKENKKQEAKTLLDKGDGEDIFLIFQNVINELQVRLQKQRTDFIKEVTSFGEIAKQNLIIGSIITVILSLLIGLIVTWVINKNLSKLNKGLLQFFRYLDRDEDRVENIDVKNIKEFIEISAVLNDKINLIKQRDDKDIAIIEGIKKGDYATKMTPKGEYDAVTQSINLMIDSLQENKIKIEEDKWIQDGLANISNKLSTITGLSLICDNFMELVCEHTNSGVGALYLYDEKTNRLNLNGAFALGDKQNIVDSFEIGHGIVGQVARQKEAIFLENLDEQESIIESSIAKVRPSNAYILPLMYEKTLLGVIELASTKKFRSLELEFLNQSAEHGARYIFASLKEEEIRIAFEKSQKSNEALNAQSEELKQINEEMKQQQQKLEESNVKMEEQQQELKMQSLNFKEGIR